MRRSWGLVVTIAAVGLALAGAGAAQARVVFVHGRGYGITYRPGSPAAVGGPGAIASPLTVGGAQPPLVYGGGPLMLYSKLYLVFWGPSGSFPTTYTQPIIQWAKDLHTDQTQTTDEFSVADQYADASGHHITGHVSMMAAVFDTTPYPAVDTANGCSAAAAPCVTDPQIQTELTSDIAAHAWPSDAAPTPEQQYLVFTPPGVNTCLDAFSGDCTNTDTCAWHGQVVNLGTTGRVATYDVLPEVPGCDSGQAPAGADHNADTDGTLDSGIHEVVESATDPAPDSSGYTDANGEEIADKCVLTLSQVANYGTPLGGVFSIHTAYNQLIGHHTYYTQQMWSNAATQAPASTSPAGCIQRLGPSPAFTGPATQAAGTALTFDGTHSTDVAGPLTSHLWNFGDGSPTVDAAKTTHAYATPGTYTVTLTVSDASGSANATTEVRTVKVT